MLAILGKEHKSKLRKQLNTEQLAIVQEIDKYELNGTYKFLQILCPICGSALCRTIGETDRYGTNLITVQCKRCSLVYTNPQYRESDYDNFYRNQYRDLYDSGIEIESFWNEQKNRGKKLVNFVRSEINLDGAQVVEIGCGAGGILSAFKDAGATILGCDLGQSYIEFGKGKSLNLVTGSIKDLASNSADLLVYCHVLEHICNLEKEFYEIKRVLKPDGLLLIEVPGLFAIWRTYGGNIRNYFQNAHLWHFSNGTLDLLLKKNSFSPRKKNYLIQSVYQVETASGTVNRKILNANAEFALRLQALVRPIMFALFKIRALLLRKGRL